MPEHASTPSGFAPPPAADQHLHVRLLDGLEQMGVSLNEGQVASLLGYVALLDKWNRVYNLTAVRSPEQMISRHLLDSLAILPYLGSGLLTDVGSGAGLPGIPVAIAEPQRPCTLIDSNVKKTRFIQQAVAELALPNVRVVHSRVEDADLTPADTVVSRAFSSPLDIIDAASHLCAKNGVIVFMLGHTRDLLDTLPAGYALTRLDAVTIPFESATRHIAVCELGS